MSKFKSLQDAYKHFEENSGGSNTGFFSLKNDRETAVVRFLHEGEDDLDWYIVHEVDIQGKQRKVKCTEEGDCPLCMAGNRPQLKIFLQLVDKREPDKIKIWERGRTFIPIIMSFIQRYGSLCAQPVEVERLGKPRDTNTTYQLYPLEKDNKTLDQLPKREVLAQENGFILVKDNATLQQIAQGTFIPASNNNSNSGGNFGNNGGYQGGGFNNQQQFNQQQDQQPNQGIQERQAPQPGTDIF